MDHDEKAARRAEWQAGADKTYRQVHGEPAAPPPCEACVAERARPVGWIGTAAHVHVPYDPQGDR